MAYTSDFHYVVDEFDLDDTYDSDPEAIPRWFRDILLSDGNYLDIELDFGDILCIDWMQDHEGMHYSIAYDTGFVLEASVENSYIFNSC